MIIYCAKNKINNKVYIGKTIKPLCKRMSDHKYEAFKRHRQSKFYNALREFGWENFSWSILGKTNTLTNLKKLERKLIISFNAIEEGYNSQIR